MAAQISARKMREWQVYAELEPFGATADFWQAGLISSTLYNVNRTKKSQKELSPEDRMPLSMVQQPDAKESCDVGTQALQAFQEMDKLNGSRRGQ